MIRLTGRVMHGLDEFMLRTGHLKIVSNVATEMGGVRHRVERTAAEVFTSFREVPSAQLAHLAEYLEIKHLCEVENGDDKRERSQYRYPDLIVAETSSGRSVCSRTGEQVAVWWQDLCFCDPRLPSMVGSVTTKGKSGSKTGLSHVFDWAEGLGLLSTSGQSTPMARLLAKLHGKTCGMEWLENPYILGLDKLVLGVVVITSDLDIFSRFITRLAEGTFPLKKRSAARLFASTVVDLVEEADHAAYLGPRPRFHIGDLLRDLRKSARRNDVELGDTSISWHRAASRLETYVDLGFLAKDERSALEKYEYIYYPTPLLAGVARSLEECADPDEWVETRLIEALLGHPTVDAPLDLDRVGKLLPPILRAMHVASTALPIDVVAIGIVQSAAEEGHFMSLGTGRLTVEELAKKHSDVARLARGSRGQRAEFITIDPRRFSE